MQRNRITSAACLLAVCTAHIAVSSVWADDQRPESDSARTEKLVQGILARSQAMFSGRITYRLKYGFAHLQRVSSDAEWQFSFSGLSWAYRNSTGSAEVTHNGKYVTHVRHPQADGTIFDSASVRKPRAQDEHGQHAPVFAGTIWSKQTLHFIRANKDRARITRSDQVEGKTLHVLEWPVETKDVSQAFRSVVVGDRLHHPGTLRLFVLPELGYVLPRIEHVSARNGGELDAVFEARDFYEAAPGLFFPRECNQRTFGERGEVCYYAEYTIRRTEKINEAIGDEEFTVVLPEGTAVHDAREPKKVQAFRVGPVGPPPESLQDVVAFARPASGGRTWLAALITGFTAGVAVLASVYFVVTRWRRSQHGNR